MLAWSLCHAHCCVLESKALHSTPMAKSRSLKQSQQFMELHGKHKQVLQNWACSRLVPLNAPITNEMMTCAGETLWCHFLTKMAFAPTGCCAEAHQEHAKTEQFTVRGKHQTHQSPHTTSTLLQHQCLPVPLYALLRSSYIW